MDSELDLHREQTLVDQEFPDTGSAAPTEDSLDRYWWVSFWQNRFCSAPEHSGDQVRVNRLSEYYAARELPSAVGYREFFHDADVAHELMLCLPTGPGRTRRLLFTRSRGTRDFTDRDCSILALLRPHLHAAWLAAEHARRGVADLTPREWEVLALAAEGRRNSEIAHSLFLSPATVRKHLEHVFDKLGVRIRTAAAALALPQHVSAPYRSLTPSARGSAVPGSPQGESA